MIEFLNANPWAWPVLVTVVVWPVVSGLYLTVVDSRLPRTDEEWVAAFARNRWAAAFNSFAKVAGFNIPGVARTVRAFFSGGPPGILLSKAPTSTVEAKALASAVADEMLRRMKADVAEVKKAISEHPPAPPLAPIHDTDDTDTDPQPAVPK